ncbi:MAG: TM2 domain-containing protein [Halioglobus sp.]|nr:TM2 domain-containing protein [Halioglobus sp.]
MDEDKPSHSILIGYVLWIFGFIGAHRFYYGKQVTGVIWFFTLGLFFIGWIIDLLLIPAMARQADRRFTPGPINYSLAWILLTFLGALGLHRFYMGKVWTGLLYLAASGVFIAFPFAALIIVIGLLYDFLTLNEQLSDLNKGI